MNTDQTYDYRGFHVEINAVRKDKFDFGDFGWAFQVYEGEVPCFRLRAESSGGRANDQDREYLLNWAKAQIKSLIDTDTLERNQTYCYDWFLLNRNIPPQKVTCEDL